MKKHLLITWLLLIVLTIVSAIISWLFYQVNFLEELIIILSVLKFIGVAFYFMDLKKAHAFWKTTILVFLLFFLITIILV